MPTSRVKAPAPDSIELRYDDMAAFLEDVSRYIALDLLCIRTPGDLPVGAMPKVRIRLPLTSLSVVCSGRVTRRLPHGLLFEIHDWDPGDRDRLWRFAAEGKVEASQQAAAAAPAHDGYNGSTTFYTRASAREAGRPTESAAE